MPSPFPGMDPYLESPRHWRSVHARLCGAVEAQLNSRLPPGYVAELDQHVWLAAESPDGRELLGRPDVFVPDPPARGQSGGAAVAVARPAGVEPTLETRLAKSKKSRRGFVKITTADGTQVLTVMELLSPSNKRPGPDRDAYLAKRGEYLASNVNLLELDLLRAGERTPMGRPQPPATDYYVVLVANERPGRASVWAFGVREPVPVVPVPFALGLPPVALDLRACLDRAYDDGRYRDKLNYAGDADPPLRREDAGWATRAVMVSCA